MAPIHLQNGKARRYPHGLVYPVKVLLLRNCVFLLKALLFNSTRTQEVSKTNILPSLNKLLWSISCHRSTSVPFCKKGMGRLPCQGAVPWLVCSRDRPDWSGKKIKKRQTHSQRIWSWVYFTLGWRNHSTWEAQRVVLHTVERGGGVIAHR